MSRSDLIRPKKKHKIRKKKKKKKCKKKQKRKEGNKEKTRGEDWGGKYRLSVQLHPAHASRDAVWPSQAT